MIKEKVTYYDLFDNEVEEELFFNLNQAELTKLAYSVDGGLEKYIQETIDANDTGRLVALLETFILESYGKPSDDGRRFIKNDKLREEFRESQAYAELFMKLVSDETAATAFLEGIIPKTLKNQIESNPETKKMLDQIKAGEVPTTT